MRPEQKIDYLVSSMPQSVARREWDVAKRDWIQFKGSKVKARKFVAIVVESLPDVPYYKDDEVGTIDHRANLITVYRKASLNGINQYERLIWEIVNDAKVQELLKKSSNKLNNCLVNCLEVSDKSQITYDAVRKLRIKEFKLTRGVGDKTIPDFVSFMLSLGINPYDDKKSA